MSAYYARRPRGRACVMTIETLNENSPRCPASEHPSLLPHQLADLRRMKEIEANCQSLPVREACRSEPRDPAEAAAPVSEAAAPGRGIRATVRMGILADKPGAGKSYTVMELLMHPDPPAATDVYHQVTAHLSYRISNEATASPAPISVLVFPHNLAKQWEDLLARRVPENRLVVVSRVSSLRKATDAIDSASGLAGAPPLGPAAASADGLSAAADGLSAAADCPVVIATTATNFHLVMAHISARRITVLRIVFDEADSVRLPRAQGLANAARFSWFVTASPHNLFSVPHDHVAGTVEYLHAAGATRQPLFHGFPSVNSAYVRDFFLYAASSPMAVLNCLCAVTVMSDDAFVEASFDVPPPTVVEVVCRAERRSALLNGIVDGSVIDRLNAGDLRGALAALNPACVSTETNVVSAAAAGLNAAVTNLRAQMLYTDSRVYADEAARDAARARIEGRIREANRQIESLERRIKDADVCPICYDEVSAAGSKTVVPCCSNSFCFACITRWLVEPSGAAGYDGRQTRNRGCPICKAPLGADQLLVVRPDPMVVGGEGGEGEGGGESESEGGGESEGEGGGRSEGGEVEGGHSEGSSALQPSGSRERAANSRERSDGASELEANGAAGFTPDPAAGKIANLLALVRGFCADADATGTPRRILVFSDNDEIMSRVSREVMRRENVPHAFLKSNASVINARAREFRATRGVHALLTNIRYYGSGLDLSAATDIVLMHKVQLGMASQVIGRAQRPPRDAPLRIWKFRNDIEEEY